jgi:hypothetical protein
MFIGSTPDLLRTGSAWKWLLLLVALLTRLTAWQTPEEGVVIGPSALVLNDLNPKTLPISFDADADAKDVGYKSRSVYKPATVTTFGAKKDVRLMMRAKKDGAALRAVMEQEIRTGDMDYRLRLAFDPQQTTGLVDGTSLGFFDFVLSDVVAEEGLSSLRRLEAVYNGKAGGYTVRATDGTTPLGTEVEVLDEEVVLRLRLAGGTLFMEAGRPTGPYITDINTTELYSESFGSEGTVAHGLAWGVSGLDKAARLFFNQLVLWGSMPDIGTAETPIAQQLFDAILTSSNSFFPSDVASATAAMEATRVLLVSAVADLTTAVNGDLLGPTAEGQRALKNAQKALKLAVKAKASGDKLLAAGKTNTKSLGKKAQALAKRTILALVQVGGFRSNSVGKVFKTASAF